MAQHDPACACAPLQAPLPQLVGLRLVRAAPVLLGPSAARYPRQRSPDAGNATILPRTAAHRTHSAAGVSVCSSAPGTPLSPSVSGRTPAARAAFLAALRSRFSFTASSQA